MFNRSLLLPDRLLPNRLLPNRLLPSRFAIVFAIVAGSMWSASAQCIAIQANPIAPPVVASPSGGTSLEPVAAANARLQDDVNAKDRRKKKSTSKAKGGGKQPRGNKGEAVSEARVAVLLEFVENHHAEILPLLEYLKEKNGKRFARVIRGLNKEVLALERKQQQESEEVFKKSLAFWIRKSQVRLLTAEIKTTGSAEEVERLSQQLAELLRKNQKNRIDQLKRDIAALAQKRSKLEKNLADLESSSEELIKKRIAAITANSKANKDAKLEKSSRE